MTANRSMSDLASRWSELLIKDEPKSERLTAAAARTGSLLRPQALESEIQAAEARLGRRLPPSYREFLLVSNGAFGDDAGPVRATSDPEIAYWPSEVVGAGFLPVQEIQWLRDVEPVWDEIVTQEDWYDEPGPVTVDGSQPGNWTPFLNGLLIATEKGPGTTVLIPFDGLDEWQLWNITKETSDAYLSFRSFLEYEVAQREPVTSLAEVATLIERARQHDRLASMQLSRVVNPDAVALLVAFADERMGGYATIGLGRIGTPAAIAVLKSMDTPAARQGLIVAEAPEARDILAERGDFRALFEVGDPRATDLALRRILATDLTERPHWEVNVAVNIVGLSGELAYAPHLVPLLQAHPQLQFSVAYALALLGAPEGVEHLARLAASPGSPHQQAAERELESFRRRE